jgi:hypothetical protein
MSSSSNSSPPPVFGWPKWIWLKIKALLDWLKQTWQKVSDFLWKHSYAFFAVFLVLFLALLTALTFLWLYVGLTRPAYDEPRNIQLLSDTYPGNLIEINAPRRILATNQPATVILTPKKDTSTLTEPITVTVDLPLSLAPFDPQEQEPFIIEFDNEGPLTATLTLVNTRVLNTFWSPPQKLSVTVTSPTVAPHPAVNPIEIVVEDEPTRAARIFISDAVSERSFFVLIVGALVSLAGALLPWLREREQGEARTIEQARNKADELKRRFREMPLSVDLGDAYSVLNDLKRPELKTHAEADILKFDKLLKLAAGNLNSGDELISIVRTCASEFPNGCAQAYLRSHRELSKLIDPVALRSARLDLRPSDPELLRHLNELEQRELAVQAPAPAWLRPELKPPPGYPASPAERTPELLSRFWLPRAEEEREHLFRPRGAFYHTGLYETLEKSSAPCLIYGAPGSGRTALALALGQYPLDTEQPRLALYATGDVPLAEIQAGFGKLLLRFLSLYPTLLTSLSPAERRLLARVLGVINRWETVHAKVASVIREKPWAESLGHEAKDEAQKDFWTASAEASMRALEDELARLSQEADQEIAWPGDLCQCALSLGLQRVMLVVDADEADAEAVNTHFIPNLRRWAAEGLITHLFLPNPVRDHVRLPRGAQEKRLKWGREQLITLVEHRYRRAYGDEHVQLPIETDALSKLLDACRAQENREESYTPRRFIELWEAAASQMPQNQAIITAADVERALKGPLST